MDTEQQKTKLAGKLLGASAESVIEVFSKTTTMPCVYLFILGTVKSLRKSMNMQIILKVIDLSLIIIYFVFNRN